MAATSRRVARSGSHNRVHVDHERHERGRRQLQRPPARQRSARPRPHPQLEFFKRPDPQLVALNNPPRRPTGGSSRATLAALCPGCSRAHRHPAVSTPALASSALVASSSRTVMTPQTLSSAHGADDDRRPATAMRDEARAQPTLGRRTLGTNTRRPPDDALAPASLGRSESPGSRSRTVRIRRELGASGDAANKGAATLRLASRVGGCSVSSNSAASGRSNRCAKTAPLPRSRSLAPRSCSWSQASVRCARAETPASLAKRLSGTMSRVGRSTLRFVLGRRIPTRCSASASGSTRISISGPDRGLGHHVRDGRDQGRRHPERLRRDGAPGRRGASDAPRSRRRGRAPSCRVRPRS